MTQMLLFDFPTTTPVTSPVPVTSRAAAQSSRGAGFQPADLRPAGRLKTCPTSRQTRVVAERREPTADAPRAVTLCSGSLPLYDPQQGELHQIGDLAQLVLARYEIVHRRRAARLRRAQANVGL